MKFKEFLKNSQKKYNISYFDLTYVISKTLKLTKQQQLFKEDITLEEIDIIEEILKIYKNGKPLNKIFEEQNFYGLDFCINQDVLAPRQETEILVEYAINLIGDKKCHVLDLCTGSGCIGITIKKNCQNSTVVLSDISSKALKIARKNAQKFDCNVKIVQSDLFDNIEEQKFDVVLSNPPYIKENCQLSKEVLLYDPHIALFGGEDGLYFYRKILDNIQPYINDDSVIIFEIGYDICFDVVDLAHKKGYKVEILKDYNNIDRVIVLKRRKDNDR